MCLGAKNGATENRLRIADHNLQQIMVKYDALDHQLTSGRIDALAKQKCISVLPSGIQRLCSRMY